MQAQVGQTTLRLVQGDITREAVDAIVNAANEGLWGGGGVDGAIHRAGGPAIARECAAIRARQGGCPTGQAVITSGGNLPAQHVIHTVGPVFHDYTPQDADRLLSNAYRHCLRLAADHGLRTVAFPSISTGIYGFPILRAAPLVLRVVADEVLQHPFTEIRFILFSDSDLHTYEQALREWLATRSE